MAEDVGYRMNVVLWRKIQLINIMLTITLLSISFDICIIPIILHDTSLRNSFSLSMLYSIT